MKVCRTCNTSLELSSFNKDSSKKDGYRNSCSFCQNIKRKNTPKIKRQVVLNGLKICSKCKENKNIKLFHINRRNSDGRELNCKICRTEKTKKFYIKNKDKIKKLTSFYYYSNKAILNKKRLAYQKRRCKEDPFYLLSRRLRNRLYYALKNKNWSKSSKFTNYIGCDRQTLIAHIEQQFKDNMSWDNYGQWHLDHVIPLDSAKTEEELYKLSHYTNLQPLWASDNIKKSNKTS